MTPRTLTFQATENNGYTSIFTTDHGRRILLTVHLKEDYFIPTECRYIDRNNHAVPKKFVSKKIPRNDLQRVLREELDTDTALLTFNKNPVITVTDMLRDETEKGKPKILILLRNGDHLLTMFKNRYRRTICLELFRTAEKTTVTSCHYADIRAGELPRTPYTLLRFTCGSSMKDILSLVNEELEGGFTHILIAEEHNIKLTRPICGAI